MSALDRLRLLASALPSDNSSVTLTRADLIALLEEGEHGKVTTRTARDLTVAEVAREVSRQPSTVRGWLISGALDGYKLNDRDWRITRVRLRAFLDAQARGSKDLLGEDAEVDIAAWRKEQQV